MSDSPGRALGVDFGTKRIGLAISDEMGWGARPLEVYCRRELAADLDHIAGIVESEEVVRVVVGVPFSLDGEIRSSAERALAFIEALKAKLTPVPVTTRDEALTTYEANQRLTDRGIHNPKERKRWLDAYAAAVILEEDLRGRGTSS